MTRRDFLACLPIPAVVWLRPELTASEERSKLSAPLLREVLGATQIQTIGARYRHLYPDEDNARRLEELILGAIRRSPDTEAALAIAISRDFGSGRTVIVNGWVLSVTEARQCALYSLVSC